MRNRTTSGVMLGSMLFFLSFFSMIAAGCGSEGTNVGTSGDSNKADSADDSQWIPVTDCFGWALCLDSLVAARDLYEETSYRYPMREDIGVVDYVPEVAVSQNCKGNFKIDEQRNLVCVPDGVEENAFLVAKFKMSGVSDDGIAYIVFDYQAVSRATLLKNTKEGAATKYYLKIQ